jgi:hypothetical protein
MKDNNPNAIPTSSDVQGNPQLVVFVKIFGAVGIIPQRRVNSREPEREGKNLGRNGTNQSQSKPCRTALA